MKKILTGLLIGGCLGFLSGANLLQNGSFELGTFCWKNAENTGGNYLLSEKNGWSGKRDALRVQSSNPALKCGKRSVWISGKKGIRNTLYTRPYFLPPGEYVLSGIYCAHDPVSLRCYDKGAYLPAWGVWKPFSLPFSVKEEKGALAALNFSASGVRGFGLDGLRLERKGDNTPDFTVETGSFIKKDDAVFMASESKKAELQVYASADAGGELFYEILDSSGESLFSASVPLDLKAGQLWKKEIELPVRKNGLFHLMTEFNVNSERKSFQGESLFAVISDRRLPTSPEDGWKSRFGCNMGSNPRLVGLARKIGIRWVMCAPPLFTKWMCTEPRPGEWVFHDDIVEGFSKAGLNLLGNLADAPWWATHPGHKGYGGPWPNSKKPTDMAKWDEYVRRSVSHYYPRIKVWVLGNEPDHPTFFGTDPEKEKWYDTYAALQKRTWNVVKSVNPNILLGGGTTTYCGTLCQLLKYTEAIHFMDFASFHFAAWTPQFYSRATTEERGQIGRCRKAFVEKIAVEKGKNIPWWGTETHLTQADYEREYFTQPSAGGPKVKKLYPRIDAVNAVARQYLGEWAVGVEKTFSWLLGSVSYGTYRRNEATFLEWDGAPTAVIPAYAAMTAFLEGAEMVSHDAKFHKNLQGRPTVWTYVLRRGDQKIRVLYTNREQKVQLLLPASGKAEVYDVFGNLQANANEFSGMSVGNNVVLFLDRTPVYIVEKWQDEQKK